MVLENGKTVIKFTPAPNYHGPAVIDYTVSDGHGGTDTAVVKVSVKPVNDAPSGADKAIATNEDSTQVLTWADFGFSDPTDSPADAALSVKISSVPNAGSLMLNGVAVALGQEILKADIDAGKLTFAPAPNANGDGYASFDFQVRDDGGTAHNGADLDPTPNTITFNVIPQNDAPVANDDGGPGHDAIATCEDQPITVDALANDSDVDGDALTIVAASVADPATGSAEVVLENGKTVIKFTPAPNYHGPAVIDYTVSDGHGGTDTAVVKVTVKPVNDAPSGADKAIATNEDTTQVLTWADFGFSDPADSPADAALSVKISSVPNAGSLMLNGVAVALGQEILKADIDAGKLTFAPAPNANGDGYASFDFQVRDDGGTAHNGADLDPTPNTITFNVIPQPDAPDARPIDKPLTPVDQQTNITIVLDISGSMADGSGVANMSRLDVAKAAIGELLEQYENRGDVMVRVVTFSSSGAAIGNAWMSVDQAKVAVGGLEPNGSTDYDAALASAQSAFASGGKLAGGQNVLYFVSDGKPEDGDNSTGIVETPQDPERTSWENFLKANDITAHALGIGNGVSSSPLEPIAYDGAKNVDIAPVIVTDLSQLGSVLVSTATGSLSGSLLTDSNPDGTFGPDGPGFIKSVIVNGTTYTYDPAGNGGAGAIGVSGGVDHSTFNTATNAVTVTTTLGGKLTVDMDNGQYGYEAPANKPDGFTEAFGYQLASSSGLTDSDTLTITSQSVDNGPLVRDDRILTNSGAVTISTSLLLLNDADPNGTPVTFDGLVAGSNVGGTVAATPGAVTFADTGSLGGYFQYNGKSNGLGDTGFAQVIRVDSGTLNGTGLSDIIIGRDGSGSTINGDGGDDWLSGGNADDVLVGGAGADHMSGGAGNDRYEIAASQIGGDEIRDDGGNDTLFFVSTGNGNLSSLDFARVGNDLVVNVNGSEARIVDQFNGKAIEAVRFDDPTIVFGFDLTPGGNTDRSYSTGTPTSGDNLIVGTGNGETLDGLAGRDLLFAGGGGDIVVGGSDQDLLVGGSGADVFRFNDASHSSTNLSSADVIVDFAAGDKIDLSGIDPFFFIPGNQAFLGLSQNDDVLSNRVTWYQDAANNRTIVQADTTGNSSADIRIVLTGLKTLSVSDFIL